jgi:hypothetical protein
MLLLHISRRCRLTGKNDARDPREVVVFRANSRKRRKRR